MASENTVAPPLASSDSPRPENPRAAGGLAGRLARGNATFERPSTRLMAILGGADPRILDRVPSEAGRFVSMFLVLLGTALLACISMSVALITAMSVQWWIAIPIAVFWMALIFNLDRFLTASIKSTRNLPTLIFAALPRVGMAAVIGFVVAEPLVLQLFNDDITTEMNATNQIEEATQLEALDNGLLATARNETNQRYLDLAEQARTGVIAGTGATEPYSVSDARAQVARITEDLEQAATDQSNAINRLNCERNGGSIDGVACTPGEGENSRAAQQQVDETAARWASLSTQLKDAEATLAEAEAEASTSNEDSQEVNRGDAAQMVEVAKGEADDARNAYNAEKQRIQTDVANSTGLLSRMNALETLTFGDTKLDAEGNVLRETEGSMVIGLAHLALALLFFMFEILPVVSKSIMAYGDKTPYEEVEDLERKAIVERQRMQRNDERDEAEVRSKNRRKQVEHMLELEANQARKANLHVAKEMEKILDSALASWSSQLPHAQQQTNPSVPPATNRSPSSP